MDDGQPAVISPSPHASHSPSNNSIDFERKRTRARCACKPCNKVRLKCDVALVGIPCTRCRDTKERKGKCEIVASARGKYKRKKAGKCMDESVLGKEKGRINVEQGLIDDEDHGGHDEQTISAARLLSGLDDSNVSSPAANQVLHGLSTVVNTPQSFQTTSNDRQQKGSLPSLWETFVDTDDTVKHVARNGGHITYLGETFSVSEIIRHQNRNNMSVPSLTPTERNEMRRLHFPIDQSTIISQRIPGSLAFAPDGHAIRGGPLYLEFLVKSGCFDLPPIATQIEFFKAYFECFHTFYPVVDRLDFSRRYINKNEKKISYLLAWAVLFIGSGHCPEDVITRAGFSNRYEARQHFFDRTKLLYDAGYETASTTIVQILFMLGFRWVDPTDDKGSYQWSGAAINLATSIGMHRTTAGTVMSSEDRKLWRRIWWCIYYRDRQGSMVNHRPIRTNYDREIDVEKITEEDFSIDRDHPEIHPCCALDNELQAELMTQMVKLGEIIPAVCQCRISMIQSPDSTVSTAECDFRLDQWEREIPEPLRWSSLTPSLAVSGLYLSYW